MCGNDDDDEASNRLVVISVFRTDARYSVEAYNWLMDDAGIYTWFRIALYLYNSFAAYGKSFSITVDVTRGL